MAPSVRFKVCAGAVLLGLAAMSSLQAAPIISNGGFESGFASWNRADQLGSDGTFFIQNAAASPLNGDPVAAPPQGAAAAMSDGLAPGSHVLYQDFVATAGNATLSFDLFIGNRADRFATPASLDFALTSQAGAQTLNQQGRVDILRAGADPFSVAAVDTLLTLYRSQVGDPLVSGYSTIASDISAVLTAHAGESLRLRFAETDNLAQFQMGIDNVRINAVPDINVVPEPASMLLLGNGLAAWLALRVGAGYAAARASHVHAPSAQAGRPALVGRHLSNTIRGHLMKQAGVSLFRSSSLGIRALVAALAGTLSSGLLLSARADTIPTAMLDPNLQVTTVLNSGVNQPIGIVFLGSVNDYLVLEKASGQVKRVTGGVLQGSPVLDLPVNSNSERGLLSMVLHPNFPGTPYAYVRWTESSTGADSIAVPEVPLLGNRLDRFVWNGVSFVQDINLVRLRSRQTDNVAMSGHSGTNNASEAANHNGGPLRFGPDGKLYLFMGDQGRRGWMQNLPNGPFLTAPQVDDTFGEPAPGNAHLSGVILRLNEDGSTPADNPFFAAGAAIGGEVGANVQKVYSYGHRNGFGMAFDPLSGSLWETENADDAYAELNRVVPGMNGGWIQFAGPSSRVPDWKLIESTQFGSALQQVRYPPTRAAYSGAAALSRLFMLPGGPPTRSPS